MSFLSDTLWDIKVMYFDALIGISKGLSIDIKRVLVVVIGVRIDAHSDVVLTFHWEIKLTSSLSTACIII